jgi:hypothetical protein
MVEKITEQKQSQGYPLHRVNGSESNRFKLLEEGKCASEAARWVFFHSTLIAPVTRNGRAARTTSFDAANFGKLPLGAKAAQCLTTRGILIV